MSYRPITDIWILARPKVNYYGAYPSGFLDRARALLGVSWADPVLHVCAGKVRDYPFRGLGPSDRTLDIDPKTSPDYCLDARSLDSKTFPALWNGILVDRPYTKADAKHYACGSKVLPEPNDLLRRCLSITKPGRRVGFLDYYIPRPPKGVRFVAVVGVVMGFNNRIRAYSVFENPQ